jgi:phospholipase C
MPDNLQKIQRFVVLMMENRSFDHLVGYLKTVDPRVVGLTGGEYQNYPDPRNPQPPPIPVSSGAGFAMPFDPSHEFCDVQKQLYGPDPTGALCSNPRVTPALMNGFVYVGNVAAAAAKVPGQGGKVMECFAPNQVPCLMTLAQEFALFNFWYSSLPGPTWPNRFFVHAATSGGLSDSPNTADTTAGFSFTNGTIYDALTAAGKGWRIYHDGLPQTAGIDSLRMSYVDPFTQNFREMQYFAQDVQDKNLPEYTFIEPAYGGFLSNDFADGNSMHPQDDVRKGDALIKQVYETLRQSDYWPDTMLIITFDEHGGFFDHVPPPAAVPPGDEAKYANPADDFSFDLYGVRVPGLVISAYTQKGTVIGDDPADPTTIFDHTSVLATVEARFELTPLTARDRNANTLALALNLEVPRTDAPLTLPDPGLPPPASAAAPASLT